MNLLVKTLFFVLLLSIFSIGYHLIEIGLVKTIGFSILSTIPIYLLFHQSLGYSNSKQKKKIQHWLYGRKKTHVESMKKWNARKEYLAEQRKIEERKNLKWVEIISKHFEKHETSQNRVFNKLEDIQELDYYSEHPQKNDVRYIKVYHFEERDGVRVDDHILSLMQIIQKNMHLYFYVEIDNHFEMYSISGSNGYLQDVLQSGTHHLDITHAELKQYAEYHEIIKNV